MQTAGTDALAVTKQQQSAWQRQYEEMRDKVGAPCAGIIGWAALHDRMAAAAPGGAASSLLAPLPGALLSMKALQTRGGARLPASSIVQGYPPLARPTNRCPPRAAPPPRPAAGRPPLLCAHAQHQPWVQPRVQQGAPSWAGGAGAALVHLAETAALAGGAQRCPGWRRRQELVARQLCVVRFACRPPAAAPAQRQHTGATSPAPDLALPSPSRPLWLPRRAARQPRASASAGRQVTPRWCIASRWGCGGHWCSAVWGLCPTVGLRRLQQRTRALHQPAAAQTWPGCGRGGRCYASRGSASSMPLPVSLQNPRMLWTACRARASRCAGSHGGS